MMSAAADQAYLLARRSVVRTIRQPANIIAPVVFPLMLLAVNSAGLRAETHIPGFPTGSIVAFILAVPFIQGALFATMNTGTDFARDIQTGFLSRLSLTPMRGVVLLVGQLGGTITLGLFQAIVYVAVGLVIGVRFASGPLGVLVLLALHPRRPRVRCARPRRRAADRLGRGGTGTVPGLLRLPVHLLDGDSAQPDDPRLVSRRGDREPRLLSDRGRAQPDHHRLGRPGARARLRDRRDRSPWSRSRWPQPPLNGRLARS